MNCQKNGNLLKLVAFFLISIILTVLIVFSASGWYESEDVENQDNSTEDDLVSKPADDNIETEDTEAPPPTENIPNEEEKPTDIKYYHFLTGEEITKEDTDNIPYAFIMSSEAPIYGLSHAYFVIEIPIENGKTRFISLIDKIDDIGKIGSIAPARDYISDCIGYFSSTKVSFGNDDKFIYSSSKKDSQSIDLEANPGFSYSEFNKYCYTNPDLIKAYISNSEVSTINPLEPYKPFETSSNITIDGPSAIKISISSLDNTKSALIYDDLTQKYVLTKGDKELLDLLNGSRLEYDNVLILGADSTTYETEAHTEQILNTSTSGKGYYAVNGKIASINWSVSDGKLTLYMGGEKLILKSGTTYLSYVKSSEFNLIEFT